MDTRDGNDGHNWDGGGDEDHDQLVWSQDEHRWVPAPEPPPSMQFNPDLSASWKEHLEGRHLYGPDSTLTRPGYTLVWELKVADATRLEFTVEHSPTTASAPIECAHTSIWMPLDVSATAKKTKDRRHELRTDLAHAMTHVLGRLPPPPPDA